jgi:inhibitor of KinA
LQRSPSIFPLGDSAITIDLGNHIDQQLNRQALGIYNVLKDMHLPGIRDIITAYSSVSVFYDPQRVIAENPLCPDGAYACMKGRLEEAWKTIAASNDDSNSLPDSVTIIRLPVCYEAGFGPDQEYLAREKGLTREDIIALHTSTAYQVFMIGFLPGFPYLGKVDPRLEIARKQRPVQVAAGGVGIAGNQTGIYPLNSPGGWQIIGRTPLKLFDPHAEVPVRLKVGDWVQFFSVSREEYHELADEGT